MSALGPLQPLPLPPADLEPPSFLAVDFETSGPLPRARPWAIALVSVRDGVIDDGVAVVADPGRLDAAGAARLLEAAAEKGRARFLVAHNAAFDRAVLDGMPSLCPKARALPWLCTLKLARARAPRLADHQLPTVARHYRAWPEGTTHHDPLCDARAAAEIALAAWRGGADLRRRAYRLPSLAGTW